MSGGCCRHPSVNCTSVAASGTRSLSLNIQSLSLMTWGDQGSGIWLSCRKHRGTCTGSTDNLLNQLRRSWIDFIMQWYTVQWYLQCLSGPASVYWRCSSWAELLTLGADSGLKRAIWVRPETAHDTFTHFTKAPSIRPARKMMKSVSSTLRSGGAPVSTVLPL